MVLTVGVVVVVFVNWQFAGWRWGAVAAGTCVLVLDAKRIRF